MSAHATEVPSIREAIAFLLKVYSRPMELKSFSLKENDLHCSQAATWHQEKCPKTTRRNLWAVLALAFALRLLALAVMLTQHPATWLFGRGVEMGFLANSLLTGHGLASPFGGNTGPTAFIAPGYPLLVAAVFKVFGIYSTGSAFVLMGLHLAANLLTIALMMHLARTLFHEHAARLAGLFWACWPPLLWVPSIFWETSFSLCILVGMFVAALHIREHPTTRNWLLFGASCGMAVLTNMALLLTAAGVFAWLAFHTWRAGRTRIVLAACMFLLVYSPWPLRNARVFHGFVPLRTTVGLELWMGNHEGAQGYLEESLFPMYNHAELSAYLHDGELAYDKEKSAQARTWIAANPGPFGRLTALRFIRFWLGAGTRHSPTIYAIGAALTTLAGLAGLILLYREGRRDLALLFTVPFVLFPLPYYITHAEFRYRLVLDPLLTVLSGYAIAYLASERTTTAETTGSLEVVAKQAALG